LGSFRLPGFFVKTAVRTDAAGRVRFSGFPGTYEVDASGRSALVVLDGPGEVAIQATLMDGSKPD